MLTRNGKQYRNLEEQVLKNTDDIQFIQEQANVAELGITVVSGVPLVSASELPEDYDGKYGDAYLVGTKTPYDLYIWTRTADPSKEGTWFNFGPLNAPSIVPGPIGPQGIQGDPGVRGSLWYSQTGAPTNTTGVNNNDQAVDGSNGDIYQFNSGRWQRTGNIKGPQGLQGVRGEKGDAGPVGPVGPQGPEGPVGQSIYFVGKVANINLLPNPTSVPRNGAYLVGTASPYSIYLIIGESTLEWVNAGTFGGGTDVTIDGISKESLELGYVPKISVNYEIGEDTTVTTNGSEVTFSNLQTVGYNALNEQIEGMGTIELPIASSKDVEFAVENNVLCANLSQDVWDRVTAQAQGSQPVEVQINAPETATNGQLDEQQLDILQSNTGAYLMFNDEIYRLQDKQHEEGYLVYSHVGHDSTDNFFIKCITITLSTRGWVLTSAGVGKQKYMHNIYVESGLSPTNYITFQVITEDNFKYKSWDLIANGLYNAGFTQSYHLPATGSFLYQQGTDYERFVDVIQVWARKLSNGTILTQFYAPAWRSTATQATLYSSTDIPSAGPTADKFNDIITPL